MTFAIPSPRQPGKLPALLSRDEVQRLVAHTSHQPDRTMLLTTYAGGLRLNEVLHLRAHDIDSARMTIRVEHLHIHLVSGKPLAPASPSSNGHPVPSIGCDVWPALSVTAPLLAAHYAP